MKNTIKIKEIEYKIIEDYGDCVNLTDIDNLYTSYFEPYDYICGDYSYDKLRLKGFNDKSNDNFNEINDIGSYDKYIKEFCSYKGKHFLLKKIKK